MIPADRQARVPVLPAAVLRRVGNPARQVEVVYTRGSPRVPTPYPFAVPSCSVQRTVLSNHVVVGELLINQGFCLVRV